MVSLFVYVPTSCHSKFCRSRLERKSKGNSSVFGFLPGLGNKCCWSIMVPSQRSWQQKCQGWEVKAELCPLTCSVCVVCSSLRAGLCCALGEGERDGGSLPKCVSWGLPRVNSRVCLSELKFCAVLSPLHQSGCAVTFTSGCQWWPSAGSPSWT